MRLHLICSRNPLLFRGVFVPEAAELLFNSNPYFFDVDVSQLIKRLDESKAVN